MPIRVCKCPQTLPRTQALWFVHVGRRAREGEKTENSIDQINPHSPHIKAKQAIEQHIAPGYEAAPRPAGEPFQAYTLIPALSDPVWKVCCPPIISICIRKTHKRTRKVRNQLQICSDLFLSPPPPPPPILIYFGRPCIVQLRYQVYKFDAFYIFTILMLDWLICFKYSKYFTCL